MSDTKRVNTHGDPSASSAPVTPGVRVPDVPRRAARGGRADLVYKAIKAAIREGNLKAGHRLREVEVAEWLDVSRTPVREAFKMLEAQGMVSSAGHDGLMVRTLTPQEIAELYVVWADMESMAARYAAQNARASDIMLMRDICARWDASLNARELGRLNSLLHEAIYTAAHNVFLQRALHSIDDSVALLGLETYSVEEGRIEAGKEHRNIVDAIASRDPKVAAECALRHINRAEKTRILVVS